ncbi:MAG: hypothetical protein V1752_00730, partial [Candidatus Firestonebacteria bacterium]
YEREGICLSWNIKKDFSGWNRSTMENINSLADTFPLFMCKKNDAEYCLVFKKGRDSQSPGEQQPEDSRGLLVSYSSDLADWTNPVVAIKEKKEKRKRLYFGKIDNNLYFEIKYENSCLLVSYSKDFEEFTEEYKIAEVNNIVNKYPISIREDNVKIIKDNKNTFWAVWTEEMLKSDKSPAAKDKRIMMLRIASSKDGMTWDEPITIFESRSENLNSPEFYRNLGVFCNKENRLIIYYMPRKNAGLEVCYSEDGKNWIGPKKIIDSFISDCVLTQDEFGRYCLLYVEKENNSSNGIMLRFCDDILKVFP